jgi:hypothetical protein
MPGGYLEARLGMDAIKPSGGTAADPIAAGVYTGGHEHTMADGFIYTYETTGGVYTGNLAQRGQYLLWSSADDEQHDAIYIGSTLGKFSRVVFYIGQAAVYGASPPTFAYEYPKSAAWDTDGNAATSGTFSLTTTPDWTATGSQTLEVIDPGATWVPAVRNGIYAYWMRIRLATLNDGLTTACWQGPTSTTDTSWHKAYADWQGARQIYVSSANPAAAANNGTLKYYGQSSGTAVSWQSVNTALFSGNYARSRFASYRNLLYFVNGKESKRWDGNTLADIGFSAPTLSATTAPAGGAGSGLTGVFKYAVAYGYGPLGEWGESNASEYDVTAAITDDTITVTFNLSSIPATAEYLYVYRSTDLTSVPASARSSFPMFRISSLSRDATGTFPTTYADSTAAFPFPPVEMDVVTNTPPARCKFVTVHKNRLFLASNNQFPGRVWWSDPFEAEAFNQDENYADFTRSTGGQITGIVEFADQVVCFTEDKMFGVANVDQDVPSIYEIPSVPGVGCIAPDSIAQGFGVLCWLARNGVYVWDGQNPPERVSDNVSTMLGKMSYEGYGGSRAVLHNRLYDIHLISSAGTLVSSFGTGVAEPRLRYDLVTKTWSDVNVTTTGQPSPIVTVTAPLGHGDAGIRHPLMGVCHTGSNTDYAVYLGECTTGDGGNTYTSVVTVHLGPAQFKEWTVDRIYAVYSLTGTPTFGHGATTGTVLGDVTGTFTSGTADAATDYSRIVAIPSQAVFGTGDFAPAMEHVSANSTSQSAATPGQVMAFGVIGTLNEPQWGG